MFIFLRGIFLAYRVFFFSFMALLFFTKILLQKVFGVKSKKMQKYKMTTFYGNVNKETMFKNNAIKINQQEKQNDDFIVKLGNKAVFSQIDDEKILINPNFVSKNEKIHLLCSVEEKNDKCADIYNKKQSTIPTIIELPKVNYIFVSQSNLNYLSQLSRSSIDYINDNLDGVVCPANISKYLKVLGFNSIKEIETDKKIKLENNLKVSLYQPINKKTLDDFLLENNKFRIIYEKNNPRLLEIIKKNNKIYSKDDKIKIFANNRKNIYGLNERFCKNKKTNIQKENNRVENSKSYFK